MAVIPLVLGHNSLGMLVMVLAWGIAGLGLWREPSRTAAAPVGATPVEG
jgi:hypothetical protein